MIDHPVLALLAVAAGWGAMLAGALAGLAWLIADRWRRAPRGGAAMREWRAGGDR